MNQKIDQTRALDKTQTKIPTTEEADLPSRSDNQSAALSEEEIAERAHAIFLREGGAHGNHVAHWEQAQRELHDERRGSSAHQQEDKAN